MSTIRQLQEDLQSGDEARREGALRELQRLFEKLLRGLREMVVNHVPDGRHERANLWHVMNRSDEELAALLDEIEKLVAGGELDGNAELDDEAWACFTDIELNKRLAYLAGQRKTARLPRQSRVPSSDKLHAELNKRLSDTNDDRRARAKAIKELATKYNVKSDAIRKKLRPRKP